MRLSDLVNRKVTKIQTLFEQLTCWECNNMVIPNTTKNKKRVVFDNGSQVILCLDHCMTLIRLQGI